MLIFEDKLMTKKSQKFWNKEYKGAGKHLALSDKPAEDMLKFFRFVERSEGKKVLNPTGVALDLGCGNGRNIIYVAKTYGLSGVGYDISEKAISEAKKASLDLPIKFEVKSIDEPLPYPDNSISLVLDMMASHFLTSEERKKMQKEIYRVLKPGGWFFLKTFLRTDDAHAERLLRDHPGLETGTYIHPEIGVAERVFTEEEIVSELLEEFFRIEKVSKSHNPKKRRSMSLYVSKE